MQNEQSATSMIRKSQRIHALVMRQWFLFVKSLDRLTDMVYWPVMDIILWGVTSVWMRQQSTAVPGLLVAVMTGLVFWQVVWRSNYEVSVNLLEEIWNQNLVNLFATPLTVGEWIMGAMMTGLLKMIITVGVGAGAVFLLYTMNIFSIGWMILPFLACLLMSGWFIGFLGSTFIMLFGAKVQTVAWSFGFIFAPFSAVYYPLSVLPPWMQAIGRVLPMTYIFEGMRSIVFDGKLRLDYLAIGTALNLLYLLGAVILFSWAFEKSREKGFSRLE